MTITINLSPKKSNPLSKEQDKKPLDSKNQEKISSRISEDSNGNLGLSEIEVKKRPSRNFDFNSITVLENPIFFRDIYLQQSRNPIAKSVRSIPSWVKLILVGIIFLIAFEITDNYRKFNFGLELMTIIFIFATFFLAAIKSSVCLVQDYQKNILDDLLMIPISRKRFILNRYFACLYQFRNHFLFVNLSFICIIFIQTTNRRAIAEAFSWLIVFLFFGSMNMMCITAIGIWTSVRSLSLVEAITKMVFTLILYFFLEIVTIRVVFELISLDFEELNFIIVGLINLALTLFFLNFAIKAFINKWGK